MVGDVWPFLVRREWIGLGNWNLVERYRLDVPTSDQVSRFQVAKSSKAVVGLERLPWMLGQEPFTPHGTGPLTTLVQRIGHPWFPVIKDWVGRMALLTDSMNMLKVEWFTNHVIWLLAWSWWIVRFSINIFTFCALLCSLLTPPKVRSCSITLCKERSEINLYYHISLY